MDIGELKARLAAQAEAVSRSLLPDGERDGAEWVHDPGHGKIKIALTGPKAGVWSHFGGAAGGDLLDLYRHVSGAGLRDALDWAHEWLGVDPGRSMTRTSKRDYAPAVPLPVHGHGAQAHALDYLRGRGIGDDTLAAYGVRASVAPDGSEVIVFPFWLPDGELAMEKMRAPGDGVAPRPSASDQRPSLFGWGTVPEDAREIVIVEGEIDALSGHAYGLDIPVLSVPFGGGGGRKQGNWIEADWRYLECFETIHLCFDGDAPGDEGAAEAAQQLGRFRCTRVELPYKDMNECLLRRVPRDEIVRRIREARSCASEEVRVPGDYRERIHVLMDPDRPEVGSSLPWAGAGGDKLRLRPGELTVWSGATGSGKSQILSHAACHWLRGGENVFAISLEMTPEQMLRRMVRQAGAVERPTPAYIDRVLDWLGGDRSQGDQGLFVMYDRQGMVDMDDLVDAITYARRRFNCTHVIVDSLMRLGVPGDDYHAQNALLMRLCAWCMSERAHIHLVAHNRKEGASGDAQGTVGIKGGMEIGANASNHIEIVRRRDVEKLRALRERGESLTDREREKADGFAVLLGVHKQRNGDWEGVIGLEFDQRTYQYREGGHAMPMQYCPASLEAPVVQGTNLEEDWQ